MNAEGIRLKALLKVLQGLFYATNAILVPYMPLYLQQRGFSPAETGTLLMLGPFLAMFAQPVVGVISDKIKATKPLLLVLWIALGASSVFLFASEQMLAVALSLLAFYIFFQPTVSLLDALMVKSAIALRVSYSSLRMWGSVGFMITLLIIGWKFEAWGGLDSLLWIFAPIWISVFTLFAFLRESKTPESASTPVRKMDMKLMRKTLADPSLLLFLGLIFLIAVPHRMNDGLLSIHMQNLGASSQQISWAWAVAGAGEIVGFYVMSRWARQDRMLGLLGIVAGLYAIRWLLYALISDPTMLIFVQVSHAFTFVAVWVLGIEYMAKTLPRHLLATGQALFSMVFLGLGGLVGGSLGGVLQEYLGKSSMYVMGVICTVIASVGFLMWSRQRQQSVVNDHQHSSLQ